MNNRGGRCLRRRGFRLCFRKGCLGSNPDGLRDRDAGRFDGLFGCCGLALGGGGFGRGCCWFFGSRLAVLFGFDGVLLVGVALGGVDGNAALGAGGDHVGGCPMSQVLLCSK